MEYKFTNTLFPALTGQPASKNIVSIVSDQTKEDLYPPTITCLQPRTSTDEINNVFTKPSDGSFRLFAGDTTNKWQWANWGDDTEPFWIAYQWREINPDVTAKVEYSPYGKENWTELDAKQDTEAYSKALGNLYDISLETVDQKSDNGWFDLRISLIDASGNSQTQILSPAFKITDLTGIDSLTSEGASTPVYYDLTGMRINRPQKGQLIICVRNGKAEKLIF